MANRKNEKKENELDQLFDQNPSKESFAKIIGKARRKTILRNTAISVLVLMLVTIASGIAWLSIMRWHETSAMQDIELFNQITGPNVEEAGMQQEGNGFFEGILRFERYKVIEGIPVDWSEEAVTYSLFGGVSPFAGNHSYIQIEDKAVRQMKSYDRETKQRALTFYHPEVGYANLANEVGDLERFSDGTAAEAALSFDKAYTPAEIRESMPEGVTLKWYWVDTYSSEDLDWLNNKAGGAEIENSNELTSTPELADQVYGFEERQLDSEEAFIGGSQRTSEDFFIDSIQQGLSVEDGKYIGEYKRIHDFLKGDAAQLTAADVRVIGAVVTGDAKALMSLQDLRMIRASALGVTVRPYP